MVASAIVKLWAKVVSEGKYTKEQVPMQLRYEVEKLLNLKNNGNE